jgi:hypothetical protein
MNIWIDLEGRALESAAREPFLARTPPLTKEEIAPGDHADNRSARDLLWNHGRDFTDAELREMTGYLPLLGGTTFIYFLPDFLLSSWRVHDSFLEFLLYNLDAPPNWPEVRNKRIAIFSALTHTEAMIVRTFLEAADTLEGDFYQSAETALENYWRATTAL